MTTLFKWILTIYVFSILAWSGMLRAEEVVIDQASFDQNHFQLTLSGKVKNTCGVSLKTKVIETRATRGGIHARVEILNQDRSSACYIEQADETFDMMLDVRSLGLAPGANYTLSFANIFSSDSSPTFSLVVPESSVFAGYRSTQLTGIIAQTPNGGWILVNGMNEYTILKTKIDLSKYVGQFVNVEGTEVLYRTGPILEVDAHDPLTEQQLAKGPTMYLFSISTVTL
ncbi:MAG: hypothetical protein RJB66_764 [Pseudomonadota bacterium]|jgi:hypothetical protein